MNLRRLTVAAVLCVAVLTAAPAAQRALPPEAVAALDALLLAQVQAGVPGLAVAITFDNRIVYSKGAGMADLQHQVPVKTTTAFRTASVASFKNDPLLHEPGTKHFYSTHGYSVLGCVIEGASTMPYEDYMRNWVFTPADMTRTRLDRHYDIVPDRASGYQVLSEEAFKSLPPAAQRIAKVGAPYNADLHDTSMKVPGGGLLSTAEDLARFGIALNTGLLLPKEFVEMMWVDQKTASGEATGYGLGWGVTPMQDGIRRLTHSGNQAGASSALHVVPELGVTIAIMTNLEDFRIAPFSRAITNVLREHTMKKDN